MSDSHSKMSKPDRVGKMLSERKKAKKPAMEKLRRDRINNSLQEMKNLVLEALNKDISRYSKMEKADMLEMTVKYLKSLKNKDTCTADLSLLAEYRAGFNRCASDLTQELLTSDIPDDLRHTILAHLANACQAVAASTGNRLSNVSPLPSASHTTVMPALPVSTATHVPTSTLVWVPTNPSPPSSPSEKLPIRSQHQHIALPNGKPNGICNLHKTNVLSTARNGHTLNNFHPLVWRPWS